jgi:hypothetical protein
VIAATGVRSSNAFAFYQDAKGGSGLTGASLLTVAARIPGTGPATAGLAFTLRTAVAGDVDPSGARSFTMGSLLAGASYSASLTFEGSALELPIPRLAPLRSASLATRSGARRAETRRGDMAASLGHEVRVTASLGLGLPTGDSGGDAPARAAVDARKKAGVARAFFDSGVFDPNDVAIAPGIDAAYLRGRFTVQIEATFAELLRSRGEAMQKEARESCLTAGFHVGYFVLPFLSVGADLAYMRWLDAPMAVDADATGATRDHLSATLGARLHARALGVWIRPGVAYQHSLDKALSPVAANVHTVQLDVPISF